MYRKILCSKGICHDFSSNFFVSQCQKTLQGNPSELHFGKFPEANKFVDGKDGGASKLSAENILSHSAEKTRKGTLYGVTDFGYGKVLCLRRLFHDFLSIFFVSQCQKSLQWKSSVLCFGKFTVANKFVDEKDGGEYQNLLSKTFCLTVPKKFLGEPSRLSLISGIEKFYA